MNYLTRETPKFLEPFFVKFDAVFQNSNQQEYFRLYGIGLLLEIKRKNVQAINNHIIDGYYQGLHHFIADAPWDGELLNQERLSFLQSARQTKSTKEGYVILDDTGNPKRGDATKKQYLGCIGKVDTGQVVVTSHYVDASKDWPINLRPYVPQDCIEKENALQIRKNQTLPPSKQKPSIEFHPKWELALELLDDVIAQQITFSHVLVDSWYGNCPTFTKKLQKMSYTSPHFMPTVVSILNWPKMSQEMNTAWRKS